MANHEGKKRKVELSGNKTCNICGKVGFSSDQSLWNHKSRHKRGNTKEDLLKYVVENAKRKLQTLVDNETFNLYEASIASYGVMSLSQLEQEKYCLEEKLVVLNVMLFNMNDNHQPQIDTLEATIQETLLSSHEIDPTTYDANNENHISNAQYARNLAREQGLNVEDPVQPIRADRNDNNESPFEGDDH